MMAIDPISCKRRAEAVQALKCQGMSIDLRDRPARRDPLESLREPGVRIDIFHLRAEAWRWSPRSGRRHGYPQRAHFFL